MRCNIPQLYVVKNSTCFGQTYCPSSGVLVLYSQQYVFVILACLLERSVGIDLTHRQAGMTNTYCCEYSTKTPDDGQ